MTKSKINIDKLNDPCPNPDCKAEFIGPGHVCVPATPKPDGTAEEPMTTLKQWQQARQVLRDISPQVDDLDCFRRACEQILFLLKLADTLIDRQAAQIKLKEERILRLITDRKNLGCSVTELAEQIKAKDKILLEIRKWYKNETAKEDLSPEAYNVLEG